MSKKISHKVCPLVWGRLSLSPSGEPILCCHQDSVKIAEGVETFDINLPNLMKMRSSMLKGELPPECSICKEMENAGLVSFRHNYLESFETSAENLVKNTEEDGHYHGELEEMDLSIGNICNLKCRMCSPKYSSKYCNESEMIYDGTFVSSLKKEDFLKVKKVTIAGGEPLITRAFYQLLENLKDWGIAQSISLFIHTNMTVWNEEKLDVLKYFKRVDLCVSFDGIEKVAEYIREPMKWEDFDESYKKAVNFAGENPTVHVANSITLQVFNLFDLKNIFNYIYQNSRQSKINLNLLASPGHLSLMCLPKEILEQALKELEGFHEEDIVDIRKQIQKIIESEYSGPLDSFSLLASFKREDKGRLNKLQDMNFKVVKMLSDY